jgi:phosphomannomutase
VVIPPELLEQVYEWQRVDPDPQTREELGALVATGDLAGLQDRFSGRLQFGTAGLRGAIGAGPNRMNRVIVRRAAWGLMSYLLDTVAEVATSGVVIGFDARKNSDVFAEDTAAVAAALGIRARLLPALLPTPILAFATTELAAAAGVMVTASHNPPADNGYKVYLGDGAQIVPPHDAGISEWIDRAPADVPVASLDDALIERLDDSVVDAYLATIPTTPRVDLKVAYTALHGVGGQTLQAAFAHAGVSAPIVVAEQFVPDGTFPTVAFPNPEEPGAMDLLLALAAKVDADIAIANDPDADRFAAAIPTAAGGWRRLGGDEIGWLFADYILRNTSGDDRLVITTVVSSTLLAQMAAAHHVRYAETFTGFKWIARTILDHPESKFVLGYEQALGYLVAPRPLDKDGISAAVLFARIAAEAKSAGETLQGRLDAFAGTYGVHVMGEKALRMTPADAADLVARLRADPPTVIDGQQVTEVRWIEQAGLLRFQLGESARVQIRPSGTEPKVKLYAEVVGAPGARDTPDPYPLLEALAKLLDSQPGN